MCKCSNSKLCNLLHQYMYRKIVKYENDVTLLNNNIVYRQADPIDHLEMVMAQVRLATVEEIFSDLRKVIAISKDG